MSLELHEIVSLTEAKQKAYRLGQQAQSNGFECEPAKDEEVCDLIFPLTLEESAQVMKKWRLGWEYQYHLEASGYKCQG